MKKVRKFVSRRDRKLEGNTQFKIQKLLETWNNRNCLKSQVSNLKSEISNQQILNLKPSLSSRSYENPGNK